MSQVPADAQSSQNSDWFAACIVAEKPAALTLVRARRNGSLRLTQL